GSPRSCAYSSDRRIRRQSRSRRPRSARRSRQFAHSRRERALPSSHGVRGRSRRLPPISVVSQVDNGRSPLRVAPGYGAPVEQWPEPVARVAEVLRQSGIDARVEEFPEGTPTAGAAAKAVGASRAQIVKSLVFVCDGRPTLVLVPGDRRADENK